MLSKTLVWAAVITTFAMLAIQRVAAVEKDAGAPKGIQPSTVADYLHAVIEADRTFYTVHVVERLQKKGVLTASENWRIENTLPLPAQFLRESSELAEMTGTKVRYRLIGLWPINKENGATTEFERQGLKEVRLHPERSYTGTLTSGTDQFFQAVYADRAVTQACIGCHNAHPQSPKRDFKIDDVMGAVVISIPLNR